PNTDGGVDYYNLTSSGTGTAVVGTSTGSTLTVDGSLITSASTTFDTYDPTVNIGGTWANSATATCGGATITDVGAFSNSAAGTLACGTGTLTFRGGYANSGTFTPNTGMIYFNPVTSESISDNSSGGTAFNNVTFEGGATS